MDPVRTAWATILEVEPLGRLQVVARADSPFAPPGCVAFLRIDDTITATASTPELADIVRAALADLTPARSTDPDALRAVLPPVDDVLGPTALFYLRSSIGPPDPDVEVVTVDDIGALVAGASSGDLDEAGIDHVDSDLSIRRDAVGTPIAACGYDRWAGGIGHLMVLTHPDHRGRGHAKVVGAHAAARAEAEGLLPQWRARVEASQAVARAIGFEERGAQVRLHFA